MESKGCQYRPGSEGCSEYGRRTFGHVGHFVLSHGLESLLFHLALHLWRDAKEVEVASGQGYQAGEDSEDADSHGRDVASGRLRSVFTLYW